MSKMTPEQMDEVLFIFRSGIACGLTTFEECIINWQNHIPQLYAWTEISANEARVHDALCAFYKGTAGYDEEQAVFDKMTPDTVMEHINKRVQAQREAYAKTHKKR
jgi:hypothetical protein